ncbi:Altered inheritance of mitochondria protein 32 [Lithohypha guttulata]|uniref:Altered inheritance of mitochondria protein 32 n=1 Tax=Lithohypha guttulata TaxID=1690604 RepID=UPI002DE1AE22|nr:hypothetical protein LTR51_006106 [Lithohypha guttulata]
MAAYSQQILVSTGLADWKSKIEDEKDTAPWGGVVAQIKEMLGPKGRFHNPYRNVIVSTSSFGTSDSQAPNPPQAILFPSFQMVSNIEPESSSILQFLEAFVSPDASAESSMGREERERNTPAAASWSENMHPISTPTILICSHNSRDTRCGMLGPLLHSEFVQYINKRHTLRSQVTSDDVKHNGQDNEAVVSFASHPIFRPDAIDIKHGDQHPINVGMISHIGGHKWAGNVIVYIPPNYRLAALERRARGAKPRDKVVAGQTEPLALPADEAISPEEQEVGMSPLAGKGIWYGRVEPKHVEGIVEQTIGHGKIIRELFRGGIHQDGSTIRMD